MGAHLDYSGGPVMPMALDRGTFIAVRAREDAVLTLASTLEREVFSGRTDALPERAAGRWYDYPLGVIVHLVAEQRRTGGAGLPGADVLFGGNLPIGAGLSSSASICVGTAFAFRAVLGLPPDPRACIRAALWGEREWVGVQCGIMDPFAVALSRPEHVLWLECRSERYEHLPFAAENLRVAVIDTGIRRELAKGDFNRRVSECRQALEALRARGSDASDLCGVSFGELEAAAAALDPVLLRRARHVVSETARAHEARRLLLAGDLPGFAGLLSVTHDSLRDDYEVSVPELDCIVETARAVPGVWGGRLTGAGFGGCAVILHAAEAEERLRERVQDAYEQRFGRRPGVFFFRGDSGPREYVP